MANTTRDNTQTEHAPHLEETQARSGEWGRDVFWVLLIGGLLAAIAVFGAWVVRAPDLAQAQAEAPAAPQTDTSLAPIRNEAEEAPPAEPQPAG